MRQTIKRALTFIIFLSLMIGCSPQGGTKDLSTKAVEDSLPEAVGNKEIPVAFSLPDDQLGDERVSGPWRYALRESDGYAVITGYDGKDTELTVPQTLEGIDVAGLSSGALPYAERITLHANILYLAEGCFGEALREIISPNGTLGLYWAATHGAACSTGKDYDLVPGVIDYTDALPGRVLKRGENHVVFGELEAMPLKEGSLFLMRDLRGMEFFFRVQNLTENDNGVIAAVEIPAIADAAINYSTTVEVALTADDFIPADGVIVEEEAASEKTISTTRESKETTLTFGPFGVMKETGKNDSTKVSLDITGKVVSKNTIIYTVNIQNGVLTATEYVEEQTLETSVTVTGKAQENLLKEYGQAQQTLKNLYEGKPVSEEEKSKLKVLAGGSFEDAGGNSLGFSFSDINKASSQIEKWTQALSSGEPVGGSWNCGEYKLQTPYFNVSVSVGINVSVSGSVTYSNSHTNVTKNVYNFDTDEWETVYSNGSASEGRNGQSIEAQINGSIGVEVEVSVGAFFLSNFSFTLEPGVEFSVSKRFGDGTTLAFLNCSVFTIKPYMKISIYAGIWVGKGTGFKHEIYNKEWTLQELTGREYLWQRHINIALEDHKVHPAGECPLDSAKKVAYETKTGLQVQSKTLFVGKALTGEFNVDLNRYDEVKADDWQSGAFLGWAWKETDTVPTAAVPGGAFMNEDSTSGSVFLTKNVTLYAVWENQFTVHFNTNGGTAIDDQNVPAGGYITKPEDPEKELSIFVGWRNPDGKYWNFGRDTVTADITLTADWGDGDASSPGTLTAAYIGNYEDVSEDSKYDPNSLIESGILIPAHYLNYEVMKDPEGTPIGLMITGVKNSPERLIIPKTLPYGEDEEGLEVIEIKYGAFKNCESIKSVYFLTDDDKRFTTTDMFSGCTNLEYAELPALENGLIGSSMFSGCSSLKCVKVRAGANAIGSGAFSGTALTDCRLEAGITSIGRSAFSGCTGLKELDLGAVESIGVYAFENCSALEELYIPDTVRTISIAHGSYDSNLYDGPFIGCTGLKHISAGGVETLTSGMLKTGSSVLETLTIRGSVTNIGDHAFDSDKGYSTSDYYQYISANGYSSTGNAALVIEEGVKTIGNYAFQNCKIFGTISIPESITSIGGYAFRYCSGNFDLNLPNAVGTLGSYAFENCTNLRKVTLEQVRSIGDYAFSGCTGLKELDLGAVESIGYYAFQNCRALEELYIPDSVRTISSVLTYNYSEYYNGPFIGCTGLKHISVGGVETLTSGMLKTGSSVLESLTIRGSVTNIGDHSFDSYNNYSTSDYHRYIDANGYSYTGNAALVIEEGVKTIGNYAFQSCKIFSTISIPESVTSIGGYAFRYCSGNFDLNLPNAVGTLGVYAFANCTNLRKVTLEQITEIGDHAFSGCTGLKELDLGSVESIGVYAFENCSALEELYIPDTVRTIYVAHGAYNSSYSNGPFIGCTGLKHISAGGVETLTSGMLKTGSWVLETLTIRGSITNIGNNAFDSNNGYSTSDYYLSGNGYSSTGNAALVIEEGVKTIGEYAFQNCKKFGTISIPESVTSIGGYAFRYCSGLTDILFRGTKMPFADTSLSGCERLTVHLADENEAMLQFCSSVNISCDMMTSFPCVLTLVINRGQADDTETLTTEWLDDLNLPLPVWDGHDFSGWYRDSECTSRWTETKMPAHDLTLYAGWDIDIYTLTLDLCGGTAAKTEYRVHAGDSIRVNTPARAGYCFLGWSLSGDSISAYTGGMPAEDTILHAIWQAESVNGRYRNDGDHMTLIGYDQIEEEGTAVYLPETVGGLPMTAIASGAFANSGVKSLYIPASVTEIEPGAFSQNSGLSQFNVAENNSVYSSKNGSIYSKDGTAILFFPPAGRYSVYLTDDVQVIGERAFDGSLLERIELPDSVTEIGSRAFRNTAVTEIILPESVQSIGERAFTGCRDLALVEAMSSPETVDSTAFSGCNGFMLAYGPDEDCAFRQAIRSSGYFYNAYTLTMEMPAKTKTAFLQAGAELMLPEKPVMPENTQFTGWYLDQACTEVLRETAMPAHELTLYAGTAQVFEYETVINEETNETEIKITACHALGESAEIPETIGGVSVTKIASGAFSDQYGQVTIPASVTEIENDAFAPGTVLVCVPGSAAETWAQANDFNTGVMTWMLTYETGFELIPDPVELAGGNALPLPEPTRTGYTFTAWYWDEACTAAIEEDAVMPMADTCIYAGWTLTDEASAQIAESLQWTPDPQTDTITITGYTGSGPTLNIPAQINGKTVAAVADHAFAYNTALTGITLPDTVTAIGARAFFSMYQLADVSLSSGLKTISDEAFANCTALQGVTLPEGLETINAGAFENSGLLSLTLPASLRTIDSAALNGCTDLAEISVVSGNSFYESRDDVLFDTANGTLVKYPAAKEGSSYAVENTWSIGAWAFDGARNLTEVTLSADILSLGEGAFAGCEKLEAMPELNSMITVIPDRCFYGCKELAEAVIPETVERIGTLAFAGTALTELTVPESVVQIGADAFGKDVILRGESASSIETWAEDNGVTFIPTGAAVIESIRMAQEELTLKRGERATLTLSIEPSNADPGLIEYYSSAAGIVSVDSNGALHAIAGGSAVIYAAAPGGVSASCIVTVEVDVENILLDAESLRLMVGDTQQLKESVTPLHATDRSVVWTSSNENVATVDQEGLVTAVGYGDAMIRAAAHNGVYAECAVRVYGSLISFSLNNSSVINENIGAAVRLNPCFEPEYVFTEEVRYTSSDEAVATVSETGLLSFQAAGASIITAIPLADETMAVKLLAVSGINDKLMLPGALTTIGDESFMGTSAQYIVVPEQVSSIGIRSFANSTSLYIVEFVSGNTEIADDAFDNCANLIILAPAGSEAIIWGAEKGIPTMALSDVP